jgi:hypothetical protein
MRRRRFAWLSLLPLLALAPPGQAEEIPFGDLALTYDAGVWQAEAILPDTLWRLACVTPDCRGLAATFPFVYVVARPASSAADACAPPEQISATPVRAESTPFVYSREEHGGVAFSVTTTVDACASVTPFLLEACGVHAGSEYLISTGFAFGTSCGPVPKLPVARFHELLGGISVAGPAP